MPERNNEYVYQPPAKFTEELRQRINNAGFSDEFKQQIKSAQKEEGRKMFERLTERSDAFDCIAIINPRDPEGLYELGDLDTDEDADLINAVADRLAAYEDSGLSPEEIKAQQQEIDRLKHNIDNLIKCNEEHVTARSKQRDRIKQLEEALTECLALRNIPYGIERVVHEALTAENIEADKYELSSRR